MTKYSSHLIGEGERNRLQVLKQSDCSDAWLLRQLLPQSPHKPKQKRCRCDALESTSVGMCSIKDTEPEDKPLDASDHRDCKLLLEVLPSAAAEVQDLDISGHVVQKASALTSPPIVLTFPQLRDPDPLILRPRNSLGLGTSQACPSAASCWQCPARTAKDDHLC